MKKIGIISLIILISLFCLIFFALAYLFLVPDSELFGIVYISNKKSKAYVMENYNINQLTEINLTSHSYDLSVEVSSELDVIKVYVYNDVQGYCKKDDSIIELNTYYDIVNKKLNISMKEAKGWIGSGNSYIKMFVPKTLATEEMSINLKTSKTSNINFNGKQSNFNSLEFNVNRGDIYFDYLSAKIIKISANKSDVKAGKNVVGATQILYLDAGNSYIDFTEAGGVRDQLNKNEPNFSKINFSISKVVLQGAEKKSLIRIFKADEVVTDNQTVLNKGKFEAYYVGFLNVNVDDFDFEIVNLTDSNNVGYSYFTGKGEGSVKIHNCLAKINFITNSGDISINNPQDVLVLETKSGNIRVDNAKYEISVVSKSGNINITFNKELGDYTSLNQIRYISNLKTETGSVNIEGVDKINLELFENSDANITIKYHKLIDKNDYIINSSSLMVVLPINQPLYLNVNVTSADVFIAVGTATLNNNNYTGGYQKDVYGLESGNELYINSCGEIIVLSEDIADAM